MSETNEMVAPQPSPSQSDGPAVWELVIADMKARDNFGREKYGTPLRPNNGRDALVDAYQEALDLAVYLRTAIEERRRPIPTQKPESKRIYIATALERRDDHRALAARLRDLGHVITYDWTVHGSVQEEGEQRIAEVSAMEAEGVATADVVIVLLPGGRGTHAELGIAVGVWLTLDIWGRLIPGDSVRRSVVSRMPRVILVGDIIASYGRACAFYYHPAVAARVGTVDEAVEVLGTL